MFSHYNTQHYTNIPQTPAGLSWRLRNIIKLVLLYNNLLSIIYAFLIIYPLEVELHQLCNGIIYSSTQHYLLLCLKKAQVKKDIKLYLLDDPPQLTCIVQVYKYHLNNPCSPLWK